MYHYIRNKKVCPLTQTDRDPTCNNVLFRSVSGVACVSTSVCRKGQHVWHIIQIFGVKICTFTFALYRKNRFVQLLTGVADSDFRFVAFAAAALGFGCIVLIHNKMYFAASQKMAVCLCRQPPTNSL